MKNLETFFELSNYDSKNITNKGSKVISQTDLNEIETKGVTIEFLEALNVPVFKYKTQITIHGLFPELKNNYLGGYKNLFQNKNLSIGVKWQVVDYAKKELIYKTIKKFDNNWRLQHNSTDYYIYKCSKSFYTKEDYKIYLEAAKEEVKHIDKSLFFGNCGVYLSQHLYGGYFLVTYINLGAVKQENVNKCIENICKASLNEISLKVKADEERAEKERKEAEEKRRIERENQNALEKPFLDAAKSFLNANGYNYQKNVPITEGSVFISVDYYNEKVYFTAKKFTKTKQQKDWRYILCRSESLNFDFNNSGYKYSLKTYSGYTIEVKKDIDTPQKQETSSKETKSTSFEVVNYSDKCIAIFGSTILIKDKLKEIGAKFNPYLNKGGVKTAGWVLPISKQNLLNNIIN